MDELKEKTVIDNCELEKLIETDITPEMEREVFNLLVESRLFMPVDFGPDAFKDIEDKKPGDKIEGPEGFSIQFLTDHNENRAVPLFTSPEMMECAGARTSVMVIYMSDLADMLKQSDKYSVIAINPFTDSNLNMPVQAFLSLFSDEDKPLITEIKNDRLKELLGKGDLSEMEVAELSEVIISSVMITGCIDSEEGVSFVLIWNDENKPHLPLFSDLDEFKKIFKDYKDDVYPQAYHFMDLVKTANEKLVINPASASLVLDPEIFKKE